MAEQGNAKHRHGRGLTLINVSRPEGDIVGSNGSARALLGHPNGKPCWTRMRELADVVGLPCRPGCTAQLSSNAEDRTCSVTWNDEPYELNCVPVNGRVVSVLAPGLSPETAELEPLTPRERDVLLRLVDGMTSAGIARALGIGTGTVRTHVEHLREKLGAPTRAAIVGRAFRLGYLR